MRKITLEDISTGKNLTLFIADDAFGGDVLPEETEHSILRLIAERLFAKTQGQEIVYLSKITLPNTQKQHLSFEFTYLSDNNGVLRPGNIKDPTPSDQTNQIQIQDLSNQGVAYYLPQDTERNQYRKILLEKRACEEHEVDDLVAFLDGDPAVQMQAIKQEIFSDIPQDIPAALLYDLNSFVDGTIHAKSEQIIQKREEFVVRVQRALHDSYAYYTAILPLASQLYDAARAYYLDIWKLYGGNTAAFRKECAAFNELFQGIAQIDAELNISSVEQTMETLRSKDAAVLESMIADLVHRAYKTNTPAFNHLNDKLATNDIYSITGSLIPWSYQFSFTQETNTLYDNYKKSIKEVDELPTVGYFSKLKQTIDDAKNEVRSRANHIKKDKAAAIERHTNQQRADEKKQQRRENVKSNKATIISLCIGAAIAIGAGLAIAFAPIALPTLFIGLIIAGAAVTIMGVATLIGRLIDKHKPAEKINLRAFESENQRLLDNYDHQTEEKPDSRQVPFVASRSALSTHSLVGKNNSVEAPVTPESKKSTSRLVKK